MNATTPDRSASPQPAATCPRCRTPIPADAPSGLCPRCLLDGATSATETGTGPGSVTGSLRPPGLEEIATAFPDLDVLRFLGAGGMGYVYQVRDRASGEDAALKILPRELAADPAFLERFGREARTLARLRHPHIVGILRHGQSGGFCFLLMEFVDGANLRQALRAGRFTPAQALSLIPDLCDALQYAHAQGVLHRDIKPENILLDAEGRVKIADFGIAKILGEPGSPATDAFTLTHTGARLGTPHYMAPEQVERPEAVDHRADIYSLGVVFYELLTGELPLGRFPAPSTKAYLDARVDDIVFRALAKERELRQQSAGEVKAEVEGLGHAASRTPDPATTSGKPTASRAARFRRHFVIAAVAWLTLFLVASVANRSWETGFGAAVLAIPALAVGTVAVVLLARTLRAEPPRHRVPKAAAGVLLASVALALFPRDSVPRLGLARPDPDGGTTAALATLGLHIRLAHPVGTPGESPLVETSKLPDYLLTDPRTGEPFVFLAAGRTNASPATLLFASPPRPFGRYVLLGDGSVQRISEARFWEEVLQRAPDAWRPLATQILGPSLEPIAAETAFHLGNTLVRSDSEGIRPLRVNLTTALATLNDGDFRSATRILHGLLRILPADPDREFLFSLQPTLAHGVPRPDYYEKTQSRHGGLLAMLAVFAARAGDAAALEFALNQGRPLWSDQEELLLGERRLEGETDQNWEEIRLRTADVLALKPGQSVPMTVIRRFKAYGLTPMTNHVESAWPRRP